MLHRRERIESVPGKARGTGGRSCGDRNRSRGSKAAEKGGFQGGDGV